MWLWESRPADATAAAAAATAAATLTAARAAERARYEAQFHGQADLLGAAVDSLGEGVAVVDQHGSPLLHHRAAVALGVQEDPDSEDRPEQRFGLFHPDGALRRAHAGTTRMNQLIDDLLRYAATDAALVIEASFHRAHATGPYSGTGLGLPICQRIVRNHGGHIHATDNPGGGTRMRFTLPPAPHPAKATRLSPEPT
ncbi:sensor histidine kinase [Pilimelia columellifera]|uniref:histidine kinase n=1 Tax=Pilimelia columellifera subsp. columellifera TaxID=706583 RepID=A0ABN3NE93_9ACTN